VPRTCGLVVPTASCSLTTMSLAIVWNAASTL